MRRAVASLTLLLPLATFGANDPDLIVDPDALDSFWYVEERYFGPGHCALALGCVEGPGVRKLLRFRTKAANLGSGDIEFGDPSQNPAFEFNSCLGRFHFTEYADYRLRETGGSVAAAGHKEAFCLEDRIQYVFEPQIKTTPKYTCGFQGIQAGWSDIYGAVLDCQWIDVTSVPNGTYLLEAEINPAHVIVEDDYTNNVTAVQVQLTDAAGVGHRPDGWIVPGQQLLVGRDSGFERLIYDIDNCPAADYNVLYGSGPVQSYRYDGAICGLGPVGDVYVDLPEPPPNGLLWWTVVGEDGSVLPGAEGGHGFDSDGRPRPLSGAGHCGVLQTAPRLYCSSG